MSKVGANSLNKRKTKSTGALFLWPLVIGVGSTIGLVSALVADGGWDALSWGLLAIPVAVGAFFSWRSP
jgi:hypothetical protein